MSNEMPNELTNFYECLYASPDELEAFLSDPDGYLANPGRPCGTHLTGEQKDLILSGDATAIRLALQAEQGLAPAAYKKPTILVKI